MKISIRLTMVSLVSVVLAACESLPYGGGADATGASTGYAAGSALGASLSIDDERALEEAFLAAMATGETQAWRGRRAAGVVTPGRYMLANLRADPTARIPVVRADINLERALETDLGLYVLTRNSNVRVGPGTKYNIAETLPSGAGVEVLGRTVGASWMMVAQEGVVKGYVFESLMVKAPGTELELAGGPQRRARLCRDFSQQLSAGGARDEWAGAACLDGGEWRLAPPAPGERGGPVLLTD